MIAFHPGTSRDISKLLHKDYWMDGVKGRETAPTHADLTYADGISKKQLMKLVKNIIFFTVVYHVIQANLFQIALSSE